MIDAIKLENRLDNDTSDFDRGFDYMQGCEEASFSVVDDEVSENEFDERVPSLKRDTNMTPRLKQKFKNEGNLNYSNGKKRINALIGIFLSSWVFK